LQARSWKGRRNSAFRWAIASWNLNSCPPSRGPGAIEGVQARCVPIARCPACQDGTLGLKHFLVRDVSRSNGLLSHMTSTSQHGQPPQLHTTQRSRPCPRPVNSDSTHPHIPTTLNMLPTSGRISSTGGGRHPVPLLLQPNLILISTAMAEFMGTLLLQLLAGSTNSPARAAAAYAGLSECAVWPSLSAWAHACVSQAARSSSTVTRVSLIPHPHCPCLLCCRRRQLCPPQRRTPQPRAVAGSGPERAPDLVHLLCLHHRPGALPASSCCPASLPAWLVCAFS
jgi:hypothetical protein